MRGEEEGKRESERERGYLEEKEKENVGEMGL